MLRWIHRLRFAYHQMLLNDCLDEQLRWKIILKLNQLKEKI